MSQRTAAALPSARFTAAQRFRPTGDDGFSLVEIMLSMIIIVMVLTALVGVLVGSLLSITQAKQRQAATALATRVVEQLRALDYSTVSSGVKQADLAGDPNVVGSGSSARLVLPRQGIDEPLKTYVTGPDRAPLFPHRPAATVVNGVAYTVSTYVTSNTVGTNAAYNLTAVVSWATTASRGPRSVMLRSTSFSPSGCLSTATHAYAGPCQALFDGQAGLSAAGITLTNPTDSAQNIVGTNGRKLELGLPGLSAGVASEQIIKLVGTTQTSEGSATGGTAGVGGGAGATAAVDNDPSSTVATTSGPTSTSGHLANPQSISGFAGTFSVTPTGSDAGSVYASTAAGAAGCDDEAGSPYSSTTQPCTSGSVTQSGAAGALTAALTTPVRNLPLFAVGGISGPATSRAVTARLAVPTGTACPGTSGIGCLTSGASRSMGMVTFGGLPAASAGDALPAGWPSAGLVQVSGLTERAVAEVGLGSPRAPGSVRSSGSLSFYDVSQPGSLRTIDLTTVTAAATYDLPVATATYRGSLGSVVTVSLDGQVSVSPVAAPVKSGPHPGTVAAGVTPCKSAPCAVKVSGVSAVRATGVYTVTMRVGAVDTVITSFAASADLGSVIAQAAWQAAPDA